MPKIKPGTDLGLYVNKSSAEQREKRASAGAATPGKLASNAKSILDNAEFAKDAKYTAYTMVAGNKLDDEALAGAKADFMSWMLGSGATNATWGYNMSDPEDLQRFTSGRISKKYESGYGDDEYSQWLKANGHAQADYFDSKYYANSYKSVLISRANQELAKKFYNEVKQEAWRTAEDVSSISGDDIAEVAQNWKATHPEYANINILNTTDEKTIDDYSGYAAPEAAYNEYLAGLDKKRTDGIYLTDLMSDLEKMSAKVGAYKQKTMEDANALYAERSAATAQMRNQAARSGSSYVGRGADKLYDTTTAQRNARRKAEKAENSYNEHVSAAIDQTGYKTFASGQLDVYVGQGMNVEANNAKVSVDKQKAVDAAIATMRDTGMSTYAIKQTLNTDGRLSYSDSSEAKAADTTRKATEAAMDADLSHMLTGMDSELAGKAKRIANNSGIFAGAPISQSDRWVMANTLSDDEQERIKDMMEAARLGLEAKGYSGFEIDNCMRRNDLGEWLDETQAQDNYIDVMLDEIGMGDAEKAKYKETLTAEDRANVAKDMTYSQLIENSAYDQTVQTIESIPIRAALSIASGAVGFADMVEADASGRREMWAVTEHLNNRAAYWQEYGHDSNYEFLSNASDVGSEILRMFATALIGGLAGAAVTGISAVTKGTTAMLSLAKTVEYIPFISGAMGGYYTEAMQSGANIEDATRYALIAGTAEGVLEKMAVGEALQGRLGSTFLGKKFLAGNRSALVKGLFTKYGAPLADVLASAVGEGIEEYGSYWASALARSSTWDTDFEGDNAEAMQNAAMGLIMGGIMSGLSAPANSQRYRYAMEIFNNTGEYTTDAGKLDSLYSASFVESLPGVQRNAYKQKYDAGEITSDAGARKKSIEAEVAITRAEVQKKNYVEQHEKRLADIKAEPAKQAADVEAIQNRIANLQTLSFRDKGRQLTELFKQLRSASAQYDRAMATAESRAAAANTEYKAAIAGLDNDIANANEVIGGYQAAKYFTDVGKTAQIAPANVSAAEVDANSNMAANVDSVVIDSVQNSNNNINEATTAQNDANTVQNAQVEEAAVPGETATAEVAASVHQATVTAEQPDIKDLGANIPTPVETAKSKVYTNTFEKMLTEAEKVADSVESANYAVSKEADTMATAKEIVRGAVKNDGNVDKAMERLNHGAWDATDVDTAMLIGETLRKEAHQTGDYGKLNKWKKSIRSHLTEAGQTVQALAKWTRDSSVGAETNVSRVVDKLNQQFKERIAKGKMTAIEVDADLFIELDTANTRAEREAVIERISQNIAEQVPATIAERINAWRYTAMLGNPRTQIRNLIGNEIMGDVLWSAKDAVGVVAERAAGVETSQRTKAIVGNSDADKSLETYAKDTMDDARSLLNEDKFDSVSGIEKSIKDKRRIFKSGALESWRKATNWALTKGDDIFIDRQYVRSFAQAMKARGLTPETITTQQRNDIMNWAASEALRSTFHDASKLADALTKAEGINSATKLLVGGVVPFKKTPINVLARGAEFSPIGLIQGITQLTTQVSNGKITAAQAVDRISSGIAGTGLMLIGGFLAKSGILRGGGDDNEDYEYYLSDVGEQTYALYYGDGKSMTIDWAAPASIPLFMGVELFNALDRENGGVENVGDALQVMTDVLVASGDPMMQMSFMQGLADSLEAAADAKRNGEEAKFGAEFLKNSAVNYASQFVPTIGGQAARTIDPVRRSTAGDPTSALGKDNDKTVNKIKAKIPGLAATNAPYINVWGEEEISSNSWPVRMLEQTILPGYVDKADMTGVDVEITRLYTETQDKSVVPQNYPYRTLKLDGEQYVLNNDEYTSFKRDNGRAMYIACDDVIHDPSYKNIDDSEKASTMAAAISKAQKEVLSNYKQKYLGK